MNKVLRQALLSIARQRIVDDDPSHDFEHALRVLANAERISRGEGADIDVIVPAALFHDLVNHPKDSPKAKFSADESAEATSLLLMNLKGYPKKKIPLVHEAIRCCSFDKGIVPNLFEAKIIQDADGLEATGAISIMRTFASSGQMRRPFYDKSDPFCRARKPDARKFALDLFYERLLVVTDRIHTKTARRIALRRKHFLETFLSELKLELLGK